MPKSEKRQILLDGCRYPVNSRRGGIALSLWIGIVDTGNPWDHKWQLVKDDRFNKNSKITVHRPTQRGIPSESHYHKYKDYDYFYDVWSNIHYGYLGLSVGFSEKSLTLRFLGATSRE